MSIDALSKEANSSVEFGKQVKERAQALASEGRDANQVAKILFDADPQGYNYGIGIVLDTEGKSMATSETLLAYLQEEVSGSQRGDYRNSASLMAELKASVLKWQRIPEAVWDSFVLVLPSDAGTGAVKSAVETALAASEKLTAIGVEELAWPGYVAIARSCRVGRKEYPVGAVINEDGVVPVYQASPQNTSGQVIQSTVIAERASAAAASQTMVVLDRAYSGFEFASQLEELGYDEVMRKSYELQLAPFVERGVPTLVAISPTKCFRSFALRPAGMLLAFAPDAAMRKQIDSLVNTLMRARGSAFEHPSTRALARALAKDRDQLEHEHAFALTRLAEAEHIWASLAKGTAIEPLFSGRYGGLFRNPKIQDGKDVDLYAQHIYPVFSGGRCRINITGLPTEPGLQSKHSDAFAGSCYVD